MRSFCIRSGAAVLFPLTLVFCAVSAVFADQTADGAQNLSFDRAEDSTISIRADGELFARFVPNCDGTPILWPIRSPSGALMSRSLPMISDIDVAALTDPEWKNICRNAQNSVVAEQNDHPHHRSLWFNHGDLNGADFWALGKNTTIRFEEILRLEKTDSGQIVLVTRNRWSDDAKKIDLAEDIRTMTFAAGDIAGDKAPIRLIDYDVQFTALVDSLTFGDTKEGTFGCRTPGTMDVDAQKRYQGWGGHIVNAEGFTDNDAWAKRSGWVDYSGPVPKRLSDEELDRLGAATPETLPLGEGGIVIMNHPTSFRYPSWYHVRTYGLFAVNPFGIHDFEPDSGQSGAETLSKGEKRVFRYRLLIYDGRLSAETISRLFEEYAQTP